MKKLLILIILLSACSNKSGPDKSIAGAILGAGWGAGSGAVVGNQLSPARAGEGAAVGAGMGIVSGALIGMEYDLIEDDLMKHEKQLASLKIKNQTNSRQLANIQARLDRSGNSSSEIFQVFFDVDANNLRSGSISNLEVIANSIKKNPYAYQVNVVGHTDDSGDPKYNENLALARARNVASYLSNSGISSDQIIVKTFGAKRPVASNSTPAGRQLNRRVDIFISE